MDDPNLSYFLPTVIVTWPADLECVTFKDEITEPSFLSSELDVQQPKIQHQGNIRRCRFCPYWSRHPQHFANHEMTHTGEKSFSCHVCQRRFSKKVNLQRHMRIHTGEKPYQCEVCQKAFARSTGLMYHRKVHAEEGQ